MKFSFFGESPQVLFFCQRSLCVRITLMSLTLLSEAKTLATTITKTDYQERPNSSHYALIQQSKSFCALRKIADATCCDEGDGVGVANGLADSSAKRSLSVDALTAILR